MLVSVQISIETIMDCETISLSRSSSVELSFTENVIAGVSGYPIHTLLGVRQKIWEKAPNVKDFPIHTIGVMYTNTKE